MSINIVKGGKLVRVASNVDGISSTEKGAGEIGRASCRERV